MAGFGADTARFGPSLAAGLRDNGIILQPNTSENSGLHGGIWLRWVALGLFAAAAVTDFFDGYLARAWGQ